MNSLVILLSEFSLLLSKLLIEFQSREDIKDIRLKESVIELSPLKILTCIADMVELLKLRWLFLPFNLWLWLESNFYIERLKLFGKFRPLHVRNYPHVHFIEKDRVLKELLAMLPTKGIILLFLKRIGG